jgi:opacity protein-like surface antigen
MRKLTVWLALCAALVATPAFARDGAWYVGGEFGAMIVEDTNVDIGAVDNAITLNHEYGYDGGLFVGYDLGAFRIEAEAAYKHADLESFQTAIRLPAEGVNFPSSRPFAGGSSSALSFMVNGMLDFGDDDGISGFVGGGVGMARVKANNQRVFANTAPFLDGSDSKLAWQVFAGVRQAISDNIDVTVKYRFFNVDNVHMAAFNGNEAEFRFRSHSLLGGITFNFGKSCTLKEGQIRDQGRCVCPNGKPWTVDWKCNEKPPICRPREGEIVDPLDQTKCICPDRRPYDNTYMCGDIPVPEGTCPDGTPKPCPPPIYIIYFGWDQDEVGVIGDKENPNDIPRIQAGPNVLEQALKAYQESGAVHIQMVGHADRSGPPSHNDPLSCRRADYVRDYFERNNVPVGVVHVDFRGENEREVETADGVREVQNRRVVISRGNATDPNVIECPPED